MYVVAVCLVISIVCAQLDASRFCYAKDGTFGTLEMLLSQEVDVIFGPVCSSGRRTGSSATAEIARDADVGTHSLSL